MSETSFYENLIYLLFTHDCPVSLCLAFVFGSLCGSFLNVCVYRIPIGRSIVLPASSCFSCGEPVKPHFNIPIIGYLMLGGRCHDCGSPFSGRYALVEFIAGCCSCLLFYVYGGFSLSYFYWFAFFCILAVVFLIDLDHWLILDSVIFPAAVFAFSAGLFICSKQFSGFWVQSFFPALPSDPCWRSCFDSVAGGLFGFALFTMISFFGSLVFRREAMGGGDIKFAFLIGIFLGIGKAAEAFFLSFIIGALLLAPFMIFMKKSGKAPVPFGTFMAIGAFIAMLFGDYLRDWFFSLY